MSRRWVQAGYSTPLRAHLPQLPGWFLAAGSRCMTLPEVDVRPEMYREGTDPQSSDLRRRRWNSFPPYRFLLREQGSVQSENIPPTRSGCRQALCDSDRDVHQL